MRVLPKSLRVHIETSANLLQDAALGPILGRMRRFTVLSVLLPAEWAAGGGTTP